MVHFLTENIKPFNLDLIDGETSNRIHKDRMICIVVDKQLSEIGDVYINGTKVSKPLFYLHDREYRLAISTGEVIKEYDKEYFFELKGFKELDGTLIPDTTFTIKTEAKRIKDEKYKEDDENALIAARESLILLKNKNNILPLKNDITLNIFGDIDSYRITNFGAPRINPRWCPTLVEAIEEHSNFSLNKEIYELYKKDRCATLDKEILLKAKKEKS